MNNMADSFDNIDLDNMADSFDNIDLDNMADSFGNKVVAKHIN